MYFVHANGVCFDVLNLIFRVGFNVVEFPNHINFTINNDAILSDKSEEVDCTHSLHAQGIISDENVFGLFVVWGNMKQCLLVRNVVPSR